MMKRRKTSDEKVVEIIDHREPRIDELLAHERFLVPAVEDLLKEGFSATEVAEMLRVAADVLDGKNEDLY
jgi:hypothetical protein